jgi:hypothetical protein
MTQSVFHPSGGDSAVNYFRQRIRSLSPPKSSREELLLEIYQQLFDKHSGATAPGSRQGAEDTTGAMPPGSPMRRLP